MNNNNTSYSSFRPTVNIFGWQVDLEVAAAATLLTVMGGIIVAGTIVGIKAEQERVKLENERLEDQEAIYNSLPDSVKARILDHQRKYSHLIDHIEIEHI